MILNKHICCFKGKLLCCTQISILAVQQNKGQAKYLRVKIKQRPNELAMPLQSVPLCTQIQRGPSLQLCFVCTVAG